MINQLVRAALLSIATCAVGCVLSPISNVDWSRHPVDAIVLSGGRNLGDSQVRITDAKEIDRILKLIRQINGVLIEQAQYDFENAKVVTIQIEQKSGTTKRTMVSGRMRIPDEDQEAFYGTQKEVQAELWQLTLQHLGQSNAPK